MSAKNKKKGGGIRCSVIMKLLMVLLYILSIPAAVVGTMFTIEFAEGGMYTESPESIYDWRIEEYCLMDIRDIEMIYRNNGFDTYDLSDPYQKQLHDDLIAVHAPSVSNFEFILKDKDENVVLQSFTDSDYRYSRTEPVYSTVYRTEKLRMTQEEYENYHAPANADVSVYEIWEPGTKKKPVETSPEPTKETQPEYSGAIAATSEPMEETLQEETGDQTLSEEIDITYEEQDTEDAEMICYYDVTVRIPEDTVTHYITGYVRSELTADDKYAKLDKYLNMAYNYRYVPIIVLAVSVLVFIISLSFLIHAAGYHKGKEEPEASFFDKIPFDVFSAAFAFAGLMVLVFMDEFSGSFGSLVEIGIVCFALVLCSLIVLWWLCSFAVRIRTKTIVRNNLIVIIWKKCCGLICNITKELPILWLIPLIALGFFLLTIFGMIMIGNNNEVLGLMLMILTYTSMIIVVCLAVANLHLLEEGAEKIAGGDLSYKIPTDKLMGPFKRHGEHLNSIGDGMNRAVSERMKSEMFKTELIANVSHDIRTPLTSIINYTDLLSKLELEDAQAKEYLEVLTRQSARLRKLTEDVLEASKATTGNMKVQLEKMDLRVLLEQILGEYEERLEARSLQMVCSYSEDSLPIMADGRLLWRVMDNLFGNVCKYAMQNTRVYLDAGIRDGQVELTIRNISAVQLHISADALMERFVQGDRSRNTEGSGLGLSIAQSLTNLQGGTLELNIDGDLFKVKLNFPKTES
ncbi:MAG: hypothetical protein IKC40_04685 [Oscillospiraceae bacterium]|nr:hypothetical protein [Oscillospiraceae bacterium]